MKRLIPPFLSVLLTVSLVRGASAAEPAATPEAVATHAPAAGEVQYPVPRDAAVRAALARGGQTTRIEPLESDAGVFPVLRTAPPAPTRPQGALLIVPMMSAALTDPLPRALAHEPSRGGWVTFAMQPPPGDPRHADAFCARLQASLARARTEGNLPVVLVGIGTSVDAVLACHEGKLPAGVRGLAALGRWEADLDILQVPLLDVVPAADPVAQRAARTRAVAAESRTPGTYRQVAIDAPDGRFEGGEQEAARRVRGWLAQVPRQVSE
ncbi:MAG: DUF3530 family protein [Gammaproteobacteria bacterium]